MNTTHLNPEEQAVIMKTATLLYESQGQSAVDGLARLLDWDEYHFCRPCDTDTPWIAKACMVCGDSHTNPLMTLPEYLRKTLVQYFDAAFELGDWNTGQSIDEMPEDDRQAEERRQHALRNAEEALVEAIHRYAAGGGPHVQR